MKETYIKTIEANMEIIKTMLNDERYLKKYNGTVWVSYNRKNSELRQKMKMLRKDLLELEKIMMKEVR